MQRSALTPLLLMAFLSMFYHEIDAVCGGCGCNIFCCNCDFSCGQDGCGPTGCCEVPLTPEDSVKDCCQEKTVGNITYTHVSELPDKETFPKDAKNGCIYVVKDDPSSEMYAFEPGHLPVECKNETNQVTTPLPPFTTAMPATTKAPAVETNFSRVEGNGTVVQNNTYSPDDETIVCKLPAHGIYLEAAFFFEQTTKTELLKTNGTCQLSPLNLPNDISVADLGFAFEANVAFKDATRYIVKERKSRLGYQKRLNLLPDVQSMCGKTQVVESNDIEFNDADWETLRNNDVVVFDTPRNGKACVEKKACSSEGPHACGNSAFVPPGANTGFSFHTVSDGVVCVRCNINDGDGPGCVNRELCDCDEIVDKNSLYLCSIASESNTIHQLNNLFGTTVAAGRNRREERPDPEFIVQSSTFNKNDPRVSVSIFSPEHYNLNSLNVVMHAHTNGYWHTKALHLNQLKKIGNVCYIRTLPSDVFPYDIARGIQEIREGNQEGTESNDEEEKHKILVDDGPLTSAEESGLHEDIRSRCLGLTIRKYSEMDITNDKDQSNRLKKGEAILTDTGNKNLKTAKAANLDSSAAWRYPRGQNDDGEKIWIYETVQFLEEASCCENSDGFSCEENHPELCQCKDVNKSNIGQCRTDQTKLFILVATGQDSNKQPLSSVEILTKNEAGRYISQQVKIGGVCSNATDFPKKTTLGTGALFNDLPWICEGWTPDDQGGVCYGLGADGSWENNYFTLMRQLAFGGASVAFEKLTELLRPWLIIGGDPSGTATEVWGGQPPENIFEGNYKLPVPINNQPCITRISDEEAFITAIPRAVASETNFAWIFNKTNIWKRIGDTLQHRTGPACGFIQTDSGRFVVLAGGSETSSSEVLNLETLEWKEGPGLGDKISGAEMVSVPGELVLLGGKGEKQIHQGIWEMDSSMSSWDFVGQLSTKRYNSVAMTLHAGDLPPLCTE